MSPEKAKLIWEELGIELVVDLNPQALRVSYRAQGTGSSNHAGQGQGAENGQKTGGSSQRTGLTASLSALELFFDTSETGEDVRSKTLKIAQMLQLAASNVVPIVIFQWGTFLFRGTIESMDESIDYFSDTGKPLRAT